MTTTMLEDRLRPFEDPVHHPFAKWLYLHFPPRPIADKKMYDHYFKAVEILMEEIEKGQLARAVQVTVQEYLRAAAPFLEDYEKKKFPLQPAGPEEVLRFLMEENNLSQYDLAEDCGGQPVVSDILGRKRKLTREQIERLSRRFGVSPAVFFPAPLNDPAFSFFTKDRLNEPRAAYGVKGKEGSRKQRKKRK